MKVQGSKIRKLREERGYNLAEFAAKTGLSVSFLSEIEKGNSNPSLRSIQKIADALHVSNSQLFHEAKVGLGERIKFIRQTKGLTVAQAAKIAGISGSYLSQIESETVKPSVNTVKKLAEVLEVSVSEIIGEALGIGPKLKDIRERQGLTQAELAARAGVSAGLIGQIENGRVQPSLQTVQKVSSVLGVSPCYLVLDEMGSDSMIRQMSPDLKELICDEKVQSVLRLICNCTEKELKFILNFIKLYKQQGAEAD